MNDEMRKTEVRIIFTIIFAVVIVLLSIIMALFIDESLDHETEKACVKRVNEKTEAVYNCDV